jgi:hypothetical protein
LIFALIYGTEPGTVQRRVNRPQFQTVPLPILPTHGTLGHLCNNRAPPPQRLERSEKNTCNVGGFAYLSACPISHVPVVACRLAGIRTRGRSTARKTRQPEANRRTPPNGGRDLKQRRTGLFRLCQNPNWRTEEACLSCRACGRDSIPPKRRPLKISRADLPSGIDVSNGAAPDRRSRSWLPQQRGRRSPMAGQLKRSRLHRAP